MVAGIPGIGIAGLFYILTVLFMPVRELARLAEGRSSVRNWLFIGRTWILASGMAATMWASGWLIGWLIALTRQHASTGLRAIQGIQVQSVVHVQPFFIAAGVLALVLLVVESLRFAIAAPRTAQD